MPKYMTKAEIDAWAEERYENSFFAQTIIECWEEDDYKDIHLAFLYALEEAKNEQCQAARMHIF